MNSLISVNKKFMDISAKELVNLITTTKYVKGIEFGISDLNDKEIQYLDQLVFELGRNNLILQVHGSSSLTVDEQVNFLKKIENYADYLGSNIVVTLHSIYDDDKELSRNKTLSYFNSVIDKIDNNKITLCLENLNDIKNQDRLEKEYLEPIVLNNENLFFTYDLGHELVDYGNMTNLDSYMIESIRNVHIHSHDEIGTDHMPIYKTDMYFQNLLKGIVYLINNKYKYNIVFEYDLYKCRGESIEEKIKDYLDSIDFVSSRFLGD